MSLPIPDARGPVRYEEVAWSDGNLGAMVERLTGGRVLGTDRAHLDPDLRVGSLPRVAGWRALFGQRGAAQGHLRKHGVAAGDLFLFFGLFRDVEQAPQGYLWREGARARHILWGWLQVGEVLKIGAGGSCPYRWAAYHPHCHAREGADNTLYGARERLSLPGLDRRVMPGAGTFHRVRPALELTAPGATRRTSWVLPAWCYPRGGAVPFTYHTDLSRWHQAPGVTELTACARGQEFILDDELFPEAIDWLTALLEGEP